MGERLKPCPFCGGEPIEDSMLRDGYARFRKDRDAHAHFVRCRSCGAEGPWFKSASGARRLWNTRTPTPESAVTGPEDTDA
jgi:Lar family restriction alleviation protein